MKDKMFNELIASVREGGAIFRGDADSSRSFVVKEPDGPARILLLLAAKHPNIVWDVVRPMA